MAYLQRYGLLALGEQEPDRNIKFFGFGPTRLKIKSGKILSNWVGQDITWRFTSSGHDAYSRTLRMIAEGKIDIIGPQGHGFPWILPLTLNLPPCPPCIIKLEKVN